jgi:tellurite methyltransferase
MTGRAAAPGFASVPPEEAERLVEQGAVRTIDVRRPDEWAGLGTIPGALLLPLDLIVSAAATLPRDGAPLLVCCEHGVRSVMAARLLAQAGFHGVLNMSGGMSCWRGPREHLARDPDPVVGPSSWLLQNSDLLAPGQSVLDLACGAGRHALLLASGGFEVRAVDRDAGTIEALRATAARLGLAVRAQVLDLEQSEVDLGEAAHDLILGINYLHRPLFPALRRALRPGGTLLYETFTTAQAARGRPTNPDFLLQPGELPRLAAPLTVLRQREGDYDGRMVAGIAARR